MRTWILVIIAGLMFADIVRGAEGQAGVQVWNCPLWDTVKVGDYSGVNPVMKELKPIELQVIRNGVASGCVVLTGGQSIKGLKASVSDLIQSPSAGSGQSGATGKIASGDVMIRFADRATPETSWAPQYRFDRLLEKAPAEVPVFDPVKLGNSKPRDPAPVATQPVWVTVRVPKDAVPGVYSGTLSLEADGLAMKPCPVPVKLKVYDWVMPDLAARLVRTVGWMSPEQLAKYYNVPLWSDRHFELMGRSMELMTELGSRHIQINVVRNYPAQANSDTMIKWVKKEDGGYTYDFTIFDKYCDLAEKKIGKPFPVRLNIWRGPYGGEAKGADKDTFSQPKVLVLDPATGKTTELEPPSTLGSEECRKFWEPVLREIRARIEKRKWVDVTGFNWMQYAGCPPNKHVKMVHDIWPDVRWSQVEHGKVWFFFGHDKGEPQLKVDLVAQSTVWNEGSFDPYLKWKGGQYPREYANRGKSWTDSFKFSPNRAFCGHARLIVWKESSPLWRFRTIHEEIILKGNDGLSIVGADMFPTKDSRGRYDGEIWGAYAQGPSLVTKTMLGAGPDGPVGCERFEAMREGAQLCEAMIFIQKTLEAKKISGDIADRADKLLDERAKDFVSLDSARYAAGAAERDGKLYAMAAEVAGTLVGK